jgi:thiol peroxidase
MSVVRTGAVTLKGNPKDLIGPELKAGDKAPEFKTVGGDLAAVTLADTTGKVRLFNVVPSLDTPVCDRQTRKFSEEIAELGDKLAAYTVSTDLPFAQARWCGVVKVENFKNLSDLHNGSFGEAWGVKIKDFPVPFLTRAVFVVGPDDTIVYAQYVPEIAQEPDYEPVLAALKKAIG